MSLRACATGESAGHWSAFARSDGLDGSLHQADQRAWGRVAAADVVDVVDAELTGRPAWVVGQLPRAAAASARAAIRRAVAIIARASCGHPADSRRPEPPLTRTLTVSRPVGGILSAPGGGVAIHLRGLPGDCPVRGGRATRVPRLALLRVGFTEPTGSPRPLVRSCRTVSPLPVRVGARHRRSALCCTVLRVAPTGR